MHFHVKLVVTPQLGPSIGQRNTVGIPLVSYDIFLCVRRPWDLLSIGLRVQLYSKPVFWEGYSTGLNRGASAKSGAEDTGL